VLFVGPGVGKSGLEGIVYGRHFYTRSAGGIMVKDYLGGKKVIVIGGGNVAFDVARSARRLGGGCYCSCPRTRRKKIKDGIPADQ